MVKNEVSVKKHDRRTGKDGVMMKKNMLTILITAAVLSLAGCGASSGASAAPDAAYNETAAAEGTDDTAGFGYETAETSGDTGENTENEDAGGGTAAVTDSDTTADIRKKIIYTADVSIDARDYDTAKSEISALIEKQNGFIDSSNEYDSGSENTPDRSWYVTVKVPSENFDAFVNGLGGISGNVTSKNISSSDMTRTYSDNADRIAALETEQQTLLDLLSKADSVESILAIQNELTDVRAELAQLHHENSGIDYEVQYSTVSISLDEVVSYAASQTGFGERLKDAFGGSGRVFLEVLQEILIAVIYMLPFIIVALVIIFIVRKVNKKRGKSGNGRDKKQGGQGSGAPYYGAHPGEPVDYGRLQGAPVNYGKQPGMPEKKVNPTDISAGDGKQQDAPLNDNKQPNTPRNK